MAATAAAVRSAASTAGCENPLATAEKAAARWTWLALALVLLANSYVRWRFLEVPLDRDEGEYAYIAQQWLAGVPPYESGYAMKLPGIYAAYALAMLGFGQSMSGIRLGLAVVNSASIVVVFLLTRRWYDARTAVIAAAAFALFAISPFLDGAAAQAENFVLLPALAGLWVLQIVFDRGIKREPPAGPSLWGLAGAGICFGAALIVKQHGFAFCLLAAWYVAFAWWRANDRRTSQLAIRLSVLAVGGVLPLLVVLTTMSRCGVFASFWFWTVTYARAYTAETSIVEGADHLAFSVNQIFRSLPLLCALAGVGFAALFCEAHARRSRVHVLALLGFAFLGTCPGWYFRPHYFIFLEPALAILVALGCQGVARIGQLIWRPNKKADAGLPALAVAILAMIVSASQMRAYLFQCTPIEVARLVSNANPFPEAVEVARYIAEHSREDGPIMVLGSEPQIYFYAKRRSASAHIYMYPLMENQPFALEMQQELAADVERTRPEWIVYEFVAWAWDKKPNSQTWLSQWVSTLPQQGYERVALVEIAEPMNYVRETTAMSDQPRAKFWLAILRRRAPIAVSDRVPIAPSPAAR